MAIFFQLTVNSLIAGGLYALIALGFNLIFGVTRFVNFSHGSIAAIGAYIFFFLCSTLHTPWYLSIITGILGAALAGFIFEKIIFLPLRKKQASDRILLIASLGAFTLIEAVLSILFKTESQVLGNFFPYNRVFIVAGAAITMIQIAILVLAFLITAGIAIFLKKVRIGRAIRAISDDEEVARIVGIPTARVIGITFLIGSGIAGLAGILRGMDTTIEPNMGLTILLEGVIAAVVGGIGSIWGGLLGAFLLGFAENFGVWFIPGEWKFAIAFGVLIVFLVFRPQGIVKR